ncbi:MAG: PAS domain S-box protein, partial [Anaerolineales bacterium]
MEIILVIFLILFLFKQRTRFGLTPLFIVLGVLQPIQTILAATYYVEIIPGMQVSPGSAILFTSSLFVLLLIYIYQDAVETRNAIFGIVTANALMMFLFVIYGWQLKFQDTVNIFNLPQGVFYQTSIVTLIGSLVLIIDVIALLFIYEAAWGWFRKSPFLRILVTVSIVVVLDSVIFITAVYVREPNYWMLLLSAIIGKLISTWLFSAALAVYLRFAESSDRANKSLKDVFDLLSYRQRFELERQVGLQTESLLRESEGRFEALARVSPVGIFRADLNGENTYVNPRLCEIAGLSYDEMMGDGWVNGIHPDDRDAIFKEWEGFTSEQRGSYAEYRYLRPDGSIIWVIGQSVPETDHEGNIIGYVGTITDLTALKQAQAAITESQGRFETLTHISPVGIFRADQNGKTNYVNLRWCEISGMSAEEAMADNWLEGVHPDDRDMLAQEWTASIRENRESYAEYRFVRPDGSVAWVMGRSVPEYDEEGNIDGYTGTITDITELKQAEAAIYESEERFRYLFLGSPDAIYLLDPHDPDVDWSIVDCNLAACQMSGYSHDELIGQSIYFLDVNRKSGEDLSEYLENVRKQGVYYFETVQRHKDGHLYPVEILTSIMTFDGRELVLGIDRDISKRKEEEVAKAKRAFELETLYETSLEVNSLSDLDLLLQTIVERAASLVGVEAGSLFMMDRDGNNLRS